MPTWIFISFIIFLLLGAVLFFLRIDAIRGGANHYFSRLHSCFLVFLLGLIAFIFGIHADIFSSYDKLNSKLAGTYNWFNPVDIAKFPIDQYKINNKYFKNDSITIDNAMASAYDRKYTIVVDKSLSTQPDAFTKKMSAGLMTLLSEDLQKCISQRGLDLSNISVEDLFVLMAMKQLSLNKRSKNKIEIIYYLGDSVVASPFPDDKEIGSGNVHAVVDSFLYFLHNEIPAIKRGRYTDFSKLVKTLSNPIFLNENTGNFTNLYLISDFEHEVESGVAFMELQKIFYSMNSLKIDQINLIKLKGSKNDPSLVKTTLDLFRENFNHLHFYEFNEELTYFNDLPVDIISSIFSSTKIDETQQPLYLYYLWNDDNFNYDYIGETSFSSAVANGKLILSLRDKVEASNYYELSGYLLMDNKEKDKIYPFGLNQVNFDNRKQIRFTFTTEKKEHKNYYLEIGHANTSFKISEPIILRQVLPSISCLCLIYLYFLLYMDILFMFLYFILIAWNVDGNERFRNIKKLLAGIVGACFVLMLIPAFMDILKEYWCLWSNVFDGRCKTFFVVFTTVALAVNMSLFWISYNENSAEKYETA